MNFRFLRDSVTVVFFVFSFMMLYETHNALVSKLGESIDPQLIEQQPTRSLKRTLGRDVCLNTKHLLADMNVIKAAYNDLEDFHNGGRNFRTIGNYLNRNVDATLKLLNVTFTPEGAHEPLSPDKSISNEITALLLEKDKEKRGGYDLRTLPGRYNHNGHDMIFRGDPKKYRQIFDVVEPIDYARRGGTRWSEGLGPVPELCRNLHIIEPPKEKFNRHTFETKFMCSVPNATRSDSKNNEKEEDCDIISIGSNREWGFENTIAATTNCKTHTFDCTTALNPKKPAVESIKYYPYCIDKENQERDGREYITYSNMINKIGLKKAPDLFKMDVEGFEYDAFAHMLQEAEITGTKHLLPSQISVELHYITRMYDLPWHLRILQAGEIAMFVGMMYNRGGYVLVNTKYFKRCGSCVEVLFVRVFCD